MIIQRALFMAILITLSAAISAMMSACFEELDPPSLCYNLNEVQVPNELPSDQSRSGVTLAEYQFKALKSEALHCAQNSGSKPGQDQCRDFFIDKLSLGEDDPTRYASFPGLDCLDFTLIEGSEYGYCDLRRPSEQGCACFFDRDCNTGERCYSGRLYEIDCGEADGYACTRCIDKDEAPSLR